MDITSVLLGHCVQAREACGDVETHVEFLVKVRMATGWMMLKVMIESGANRNFVTQLWAKELGLENTGIPPPHVSTINGNDLPTYNLCWAEFLITNSYGEERHMELGLVTAGMQGFNLILGLPWLKKHHPLIDFGDGEWTWCPNHRGGLGTPWLVNATVMMATVQRKGAKMLAIHPYKREPSVKVGNALMLVTEPPRIPAEYQAFTRVFSKKKVNELPAHGTHNHAINLEGTGDPPFGPLYNLSGNELKVLWDYLADNLAKGFIQALTSPSEVPILFVKKKDGTLQLCVDYQGLNHLTWKNCYPLPLINEALDWLVSVKVYTKLNIWSAYNLIWIKEGDEWKTAFRMCYAHFDYRVMPFGLVNTPVTFQGYINRVLHDCLDITCLVYLDDILIFSEDEAEHTEHVCEVLRCLGKAGLYLNLEKCEFWTKRIGFVGYIVMPGGIAMELDRVSSIHDWPAPRSHHDIQVFLGFANFYQRFVAYFSWIVWPLTALLVAGKVGCFSKAFELTKEVRTTFEELKVAFTTMPVLQHYNTNLPVRLETDASGFTISRILSQQNNKESPEKCHWHPVAFWSHQMLPAEQNYHAGQMELLAIMMACKHWHHYLDGADTPVNILLDHGNLRNFMTMKELMGRLAWWWELLSGFWINVV